MNQSQSRQQSQQGSVSQFFQPGDFQNDLDKLFQQLIIEKQGQKVDTIEKSTLLAMMLYLNMDTTDQQFFSYIQRALERDQGSVLTKAQFNEIFMNPQINMKDLNSEEMTQVFSIFDSGKQGSFSADNFLQIYRETDEYKNLSPQQQQQIEQRIKKDFEIISPEHKEITPIEFFKIIDNYQEQ